tara:strand:- start:256 stop:909 length:654 start_codon:yes stop_codon:yes gene_type:complete
MTIGKIDRTGWVLLIASAVFGLAYLLPGLGFEIAFPIDVVVKAAGIVLLALYALRARFNLLAFALFASAVGDIMLAWQPRQMELGIVAFGIAHLAYIGLFVGWQRRAGMRGLFGYALAAGIVIYGAVMLTWLRPGMGDLATAATIYNGIILVMAIFAALSRSPMLALVGALLFVLSDSLIGAREFQNAFLWSGPVIWITYYLAQLFLTLGLTARASR